jgi:hypothetical protein
MSSQLQRIEQLADTLSASLETNWRVAVGKRDPCDGYVANPKDNTLASYLEEAFKVSFLLWLAV